MQVHDELIFEVAEKDLEKAQAKIVDIMQNSSKIDVPLFVEAGGVARRIKIPRI